MLLNKKLFNINIIIIFIFINLINIFFFNFIFIFSVKLFFVNLIIILIALISGAYISLFERQIITLIQNRPGPMISGTIFSILQPIFDAIKLIFKKIHFSHKNIKYTIIISIYTLSISLGIWILIKIIKFNSNYSILFFLIILILSSFGLFFLGLYSKNKYSLLSIIRLIVIIISTDICILLIVLSSISRSGEFSIINNNLGINNKLFSFFGNIIPHYTLNIYYILCIIPGIIFMFIFIISDGKKSPFNISESESEMASGYLLKFSSLNMAILILSEYLLLMVIIIFFIKNFIAIDNFFYFFIYVIAILLLYFTIRSVFPNYRFNEILIIFWKNLFPLILLTLFINMFFLYFL